MGQRLTTLLLCSVLLISCISCARTLSKSNNPLRLSLTITFKNPINQDANAITLIVTSKNRTIKPQIAGTSTYFIVPSKQVNTTQIDSENKTIQDYYQSYFSTWEQVIYIDNTHVQLIRPDSGSNPTADAFLATTTQNMTYEASRTFQHTLSYSADGTQLTLSCDIDQLQRTENTILYVALYTLSRTDVGYDAGTLQDLLGETIPILLKQYEEEQSPFLTTNTLIPGSNDIIKWHYQLY